MTSILFQKINPPRSLLQISIIFAALSMCYVANANAQQSSSVTGVWYDSAREGAIEVAPCGKRMCGNIVWLKSPLNAEGKPLFDRHNPNATQQTRPICGLQVLRDLQPLIDGSWGRGIVYDPKKGAENEASIKSLGAGKLQLTGYGLFGLSKSFEWTRAPADLPKCGKSGNTASDNGVTKGIAPPVAGSPTQVPKTNTEMPASKPATASSASSPGVVKPAAPAPPAKAGEPAPKAPQAPKPSSAAPSHAPTNPADVGKKAAATAPGPSTKTIVKPAVAASAGVQAVKPKTQPAVQKTTTSTQKKPAAVNAAVKTPAATIKAATAKASTTTKTAAKPITKVAKKDGSKGDTVNVDGAAKASADTVTVKVIKPAVAPAPAPVEASVAPSVSTSAPSAASPTAAGFAD